MLADQGGVARTGAASPQTDGQALTLRTWGEGGPRKGGNEGCSAPWPCRPRDSHFADAICHFEPVSRQNLY